jgi:hypothetical protein
MHADVKIIDPIWSGAYITRNCSDRLYDTLFAVDAKRAIRWGRSSRRTGPTSSGRSRRPQIVTHAPLGEWFGVSVAKDKIQFATTLAPVTVFWRIPKK